MFHTITTENAYNEGYLFGTLLAILIALRILDELFGQQWLAKLRAEDTLKGKARLRRFGKLWLWGSQLIFAAFLCHSLYVHSVTFAAIFGLVFTAHGLYMANILSSRIEITDTRITFKTIFRTHIIETSGIRKACWVSKSRSFGYTLVLNLTGGASMELSQIYFVGLNDLWERFGGEDS